MFHHYDMRELLFPVIVLKHSENIARDTKYQYVCCTRCLSVFMDLNELEDNGRFMDASLTDGHNGHRKTSKC